jgi:DNA-binding response OmpR family regulator
MPKVLLISDARAYIAAAEAAFRDGAHALRCEPTVERGLLAARDDPPGLLCVDLGVGLTAGGLAALLRDPQVEAGVALLAIAEPSQFHLVAAGVPVGDVIVPPLDPEELRLRAERLLDAGGEAAESGLLHRGALVIDQDRYTVRLGEDVLDLTYKEYELLRFLALNPGKAFTREMLLNQVWGYDYYGGSRTVDVHIRRIRAKIERHEPYIETVRNVGYRFVEVVAPR